MPSALPTCLMMLSKWPEVCGQMLRLGGKGSEAWGVRGAAVGFVCAGMGWSSRDVKRELESVGGGGGWGLGETGSLFSS